MAWQPKFSQTDRVLSIVISFNACLEWKKQAISHYCKFLPCSQTGGSSDVIRYEIPSHLTNMQPSPTVLHVCWMAWQISAQFTWSRDETGGWLADVHPTPWWEPSHRFTALHHLLFAVRAIRTCQTIVTSWLQKLLGCGKHGRKYRTCTSWLCFLSCHVNSDVIQVMLGTGSLCMANGCNLQAMNTTSEEDIK